MVGTYLGQPQCIPKEDYVEEMIELVDIQSAIETI